MNAHRDRRRPHQALLDIILDAAARAARLRRCLYPRSLIVPLANHDCPDLTTILIVFCRIYRKILRQLISFCNLFTTAIS
jgi:hypothetical protein